MRHSKVWGTKQIRALRIRENFNVWWKSIDRERMVSAHVGAVRFKVLEGKRKPFMARVIPNSASGRRLELQVSRGLLQTTRADVVQNIGVICTACFPENACLAAHQEVRRALSAYIR